MGNDEQQIVEVECPACGEKVQVVLRNPAEEIELKECPDGHRFSVWQSEAGKIIVRPY